MHYSAVYDVHVGSFGWKSQRLSTNAVHKAHLLLQGSWLDSAWRQMSWVSVGHQIFRNLGFRQHLGPDMCLHGFYGYRFSSASVQSVLGLQRKLRDGSLHSEKARGFVFNPWKQKRGVLKKSAHFSLTIEHEANVSPRKKKKGAF